MSQFNVYQVDDALCLQTCLSHCLFLSLSSFCSTMHSPTYQPFTHPFILFLTLSLYFSLSLSLVCTCVRACVSLSPSFSRFRPCILSLRLSVCLSLSLLHTHSRTRSQTIATHIRTLTLSHLFTRSSTHSLLSRVRAALSVARAQAHALFSLFLSPFLPFLFFSFAILSLLLSSSRLARLLPRHLSLNRSLPLFFNSW